MHIDGGNSDVCRPNGLISAALLALMLLCPSTALAGEDAPYPIWWSPQLELESLDQFDEPFGKEFGPGKDGRMRVHKGERPNEEDAYAFDCRSILKLDSEGFFPRFLTAMQQFQRYTERCEIMELLRDTKPSQQSFVSNFVLDPAALDYLPVMLKLSPSCSGLCQFYGANQRRTPWRAFEFGKSLKYVIENDYHMTVETELVRIDLEILGRADSNDDGLEDIFVRSIVKAKEGRWGDEELFTLTRDDPEGVFWILDAENYVCTLESYRPCKKQ